MKPDNTATTLLHLDASPRGERSKSRQLGAEFVARWRAAHANARVVTRDIGREPPPFVTEAWVEGAFAPADSQSYEARQAIAVSNTYVDELLAADQLLVTTPMYNLSRSPPYSKPGSIKSSARVAHSEKPPPGSRAWLPVNAR